MVHRELKNKPLVEAILEVKWALIPSGPGRGTDPHYKLLLGRLFDRVAADYPEHEQLPAANIPDELVGHMVQHRFRIGPNRWPLVQLGPGILTVNSTADYTWSDFRPRAVTAIQRLYDAHPKVGDLKINNLVLRYIDAVEFDYTTKNVFEFFREKLKVTSSLPTSLFEGTGVQEKPSEFIWQSAFVCNEPRGTVRVRFATGQKDNKPALMWETTIQSVERDVPTMPSGFEVWIDAAHGVTDDWFFKLIEGELEEIFA